MLTEAAIAAAKESKSLTNGVSAFITNATFTVSDYTYDDAEGTAYPALVTSIGNISVGSLIRAKSVKPYKDKDDNIITSRQPQGTFHDLIRKVCTENRGKTNDEVLPLIVKACEGLTFKVRLREYVTVETKYGDRAQPLCHIDIKD